MDSSHLRSTHADPPASVGETSLEASDESPEPDATPRYCPTTLLASFALLMAGHGRCVNTDMMLGDREYAMWQLACARATDDAELCDVAARLFAYFDDPQHSGMPVLGTA
jgi:hypothetical protein